MQKRIKLGICIPTRDTWKAHFGQSLAMSMASVWSLLPPDTELGVKTFNKTQSSIVHTARNNLAQEAIDSDCTHILFLDDDMLFPMNTFSALLTADKDIVAANCVTKEWPPRTTANKIGGGKVFTRRSSEGLEEVESVGTAVMMIKREVFEKLPKPWFDNEWINVEENKFTGEDRYFCYKAREHGFKVYIDHDLSKEIKHIGEWFYSHGMTEEWDK